MRWMALVNEINSRIRRRGADPDTVEIGDVDIVLADPEDDVIEEIYVEVDDDGGTKVVDITA